LVDPRGRGQRRAGASDGSAQRGRRHTRAAAANAGQNSGKPATDQDNGYVPDGFVVTPDSGNQSATANGSSQQQSVPGLEVLQQGDVVRIEEDWEVELGGPAPELVAPQLGTVMTPFADTDGFYLAFVLNHRQNPEFQPGGLELQIWHSGELLGWLNVGDALLSEPGERISWTQVLRLDRGQGLLCFEVKDGHSATWGDFGTARPLRICVHSTLENLNSYNPLVSVQNSGVTFAANRVKSMVLKAVRGYSASGELLFQQSAPAKVYDRNR